ncbi:MAG: Ig-like domain repeat protein [Actinobacteria bacterium]|nr:Ig-like domain repeat protein [Actinomycetota bacterium]
MRRLGRLLVRSLAAASVAAVMLMAWAGAAQAAIDTLFAAPGAPESGECGSPASACSLAYAVNQANGKPTSDDVTIKLAGGVYGLNGIGPTALPVTFAGPGLTLEPEGGGLTPTLRAEGSLRLLSVDAGATVRIVGLAIENGDTTGLGGAIENRGALTVANSTFSENSAANGGAIANISGGSLTVEDSTFAGNSTSSVGGGAIIAFAPATIERSTLVDNTAPTNGGAINVQPSASVTIVGSTLAGNESGSLGGALSNLGTLYVVGSTFVGNKGSAGSAIATGNNEATFATDIIGPQEDGEACSPTGTAFVDSGYNLDVDGSCISATTPGIGSHNGTTPLGSSTYGEVLDAYLADGLADNSGPTETIALLNTPNPFTSEPDPAFDVVPPGFELPTPVGAATTACALPDQRGYFPLVGANCAIGAFLRTVTKTEVAVSSAEVVQGDTVTYTVTVSPSAEGGTVAFDDGAGNPASTNCPAREVVGGKATCTVSYGNTGTYSAGAVYSGDGDKNSFVGSATTASATVTVKAKPKVEEQPAPPAPAPPKVRLKVSYTPNHPHAPNPAGGPRYTFLFSAQGDGVTFYCQLDKATFKRCRSPKVYRNLERGRHVFKVKARDAAGSYTRVATVKFFAGRRTAG